MMRYPWCVICESTAVYRPNDRPPNPQRQHRPALLRLLLWISGGRTE